MKIEDRITYERDKIITQLDNGQRYGAKMDAFADIAGVERDVFNRLGAYEDTGLSPEEIEAMKHENDRLLARFASLEAQRQELPAAEGRKIKCEIHITVEGLRGRDACQNDGKQKQRIPWEAD